MKVVQKIVLTGLAGAAAAVILAAPVHGTEDIGAGEVDFHVVQEIRSPKIDGSVQ